MSQSNVPEDFDSLLAKAVYDTLKYCLGETNADVIAAYFEKRNVLLLEISKNPELFSDELRNIVGFNRRQILGAASILEETILELLCKRLGIKLEVQRPVNFPLEIRKLKKQYEQLH